MLSNGCFTLPRLRLVVKSPTCDKDASAHAISLSLVEAPITVLKQIVNQAKPPLSQLPCCTHALVSALYFTDTALHPSLCVIQVKGHTMGKDREEANAINDEPSWADPRKPALCGRRLAITRTCTDQRIVDGTVR